MTTILKKSPEDEDCIRNFRNFIARYLLRDGRPITANTVGCALKELGFSIADRRVPFDCSKLINGCEAWTRNGDIVTQLTYFHADEEQVYVIYGVLNGRIHCWRANGSWYLDDERHPNDLALMSESE